MNYQHILDQLLPAVKTVARQEVLFRFNNVYESTVTKRDGSVVTEADLAAQTSLTDYLRQQWPDIPMLGEEMSAIGQQQLLESAGSFWCLDPLDGTSNFASGIPFFAVSLALVEQGQVKLGLIYDPVRDECYSAIEGGGSYLNGKPLLNGNESTESLDSLIAVVDLKRLPWNMLEPIVREHPFRSQRNFGSCALEWCWLAAGRFQIYLHGGMKIWDHSAGSLILSEAKGYSTSFDGESVFKPVLSPRPVIAACNRSSHDLWKQWIDNHV